MKRIVHGNLAVNLEQSHARQTRPRRRTKKVTIRYSLPIREKLIYLFIVLLTVAVSGLLLSRYAASAELNYKIEGIKREISEMKKENELLQLQVSELSSPDRILEQAKKLGMTQKDGNVKILSVPPKK